jgi:hypothetical protein
MSIVGEPEEHPASPGCCADIPILFSVSPAVNGLALDAGQTQEQQQMCGRVVHMTPLGEIRVMFETVSPVPNSAASYNAAPTDTQQSGL